MTEDKKEPKSESASGSRQAYRVEARYSYFEPMTFGDRVFDKEWREITFPESAMGGVPPGARWDLPELMSFRCYSYQAAQALRWWFHAELEAHKFGGGLCMETRIVKYEITYTRECKRVSEHAFISGEDRSNCIPDWGKKS